MVNGKDTYKVTLITYDENFQEISREELEPEIIYFLNKGNLSTYKELPKTNIEYQNAQIEGFKGNIEDYFSKRDYT